MTLLYTVLSLQVEKEPGWSIHLVHTLEPRPDQSPVCFNAQ